jgi:hypothetical protein
MYVRTKPFSEGTQELTNFNMLHDKLEKLPAFDANTHIRKTESSVVNGRRQYKQ